MGDLGKASNLVLLYRRRFIIILRATSVSKYLSMRLGSKRLQGMQRTWRAWCQNVPNDHDTGIWKAGPHIRGYHYSHLAVRGTGTSSPYSTSKSVAWQESGRPGASSLACARKQAFGLDETLWLTKEETCSPLLISVHIIL